MVTDSKEVEILQNGAIGGHPRAAEATEAVARGHNVQMLKNVHNLGVWYVFL